MSPRTKKTIRSNKTNLHSQPIYACVGNCDVISSQISDHHPIVHDGVLFWNVMMQGNKRGNGIGFNNGFGIIEDEEAYMARLIKISWVIAEMVLRDPSIEVISLCEGPIKSEHTELLFKSLQKAPWLDRFIKSDKFHQPTAAGQSWGLLMLADDQYCVSDIDCGIADNQPKLANRFQLWRLAKAHEEKYVALAHFPFAGDEYKTEKKTPSTSGQVYCDMISRLLEQYSDKSLIFCADFNFNPHLIQQWQDRALDQISVNNSILLPTDMPLSLQQTKTVTVGRWHFIIAK
ncbi:MAG: hypothetical protein WAW86_03100 [Gammaproteobacteria bacterium]